MTISIRAHCIPAYDILSNLRKVLEIPPEIDSMEEKTAGGIVKKIHRVLNSKYWANLPNEKIIQSGSVKNFVWNKEKVQNDIMRICTECSFVFEE